MRTGWANITARAGLALNTLFAAFALWADLAAFASQACFSPRTSGAGFAPWPSFALGALWSGVSLRTGLSRLPIGAALAHLTLGALRPSRSGFAARANGADCAGLTAIPLRACLATRPNFASSTACAINAGLAAPTRLALFATLTLRPDKPGLAARPDLAAFTLWPTITSGPACAVNAIFAVTPRLPVPPVTRERTRLDRDQAPRHVLDAAEQPHQRAVRLLRRVVHGKGADLRIRHVRIPEESR